eukprot:scaffold337638_cov13-Prasinocladus_malaysianus.AAC.1
MCSASAFSTSFCAFCTSRSTSTRSSPDTRHRTTTIVASLIRIRTISPATRARARATAYSYSYCYCSRTACRTRTFENSYS